MKKIILGTLLVGATLLSHSIAEAADLNVQVKGVDNNYANQFVLRQGTTMAPGFGYAPSFEGNGLYYLSGIRYTLYKDGVSYQTGNTTNGNLSFSGLTAGTYTLVFDDSRYVALQVLSPTSTQALRENEEYDSSTNNYVPAPIYFVGNYGEQFTIPAGADDEKLNLAFVFSSAPRGLVTYTTVGTVPGGTTDASGRNVRTWYSSHFDTTTGDPSFVTALNNNDGTSKLNYYLGVLIGDTYGEYNSNRYLGKEGTGTDIFEEPTLSDAEKAKGYVFKGWKFTYLNNEKTNDDTIYTREQIEKMVIVADARFEAVFELPSHTVQFVTDTEKGSLEGQTTSYTFEGNSSNISTAVNTLPTPVAKDGYKFLGWYTDNTTNLIPDATIQSTVVNKDIVYYAKYEKTTPDIAIGDNGNWFINGVDTGKPSQGKQGVAGKDGTSITVKSVSTDANGNTLVTFSDDSVATIFKGPAGKDGTNGKDGVDGKDGASLTITSTLVQSDGSILVTFSDGTVLTLPKGKDAQALTVTGTSLDKNGNTVVTFSDGSAATIAKGKDGTNGKDGANGISISITSTQTDVSGNSIINFSDGSSVLINKGADGKTPDVSIGKNGNWIVDGKDTGISSTDQTALQKAIQSVKGLLPNTGSVETISTAILGALSIVFICFGYLLGRKHQKG